MSSAELWLLSCRYFSGTASSFSYWVICFSSLLAASGALLIFFSSTGGDLGASALSWASFGVRPDYSVSWESFWPATAEGAAEGSVGSLTCFTVGSENALATFSSSELVFGVSDKL
jgi:hypothetical protein